MIAGASLGWQVITWRASGAVVTVTARQSTPTHPEHAGEPHAEIIARNRGRSPVTVNHWGLKLSDLDRLRLPVAPWSADLPQRLEEGASASWYVPTDAVVAACARYSARYQDLFAWVGLGGLSPVPGRVDGGRMPAAPL